MTTYNGDKPSVYNMTYDGYGNITRYDAVDNILGITNATTPVSLMKLKKSKLGGRSLHRPLL
ncbi:hypothetical protein [Prevotella melaninogenica]|uniref:hypothetical protein n=1 Tax=Prevotella melaninogenica TaxID=28132 RepID=UPI001959F97E|nr:hypothetical protein [Prevotella melaninogenica]